MMDQMARADQATFSSWVFNPNEPSSRPEKPIIRRIHAVPGSA